MDLLSLYPSAEAPSGSLISPFEKTDATLCQRTKHDLRTPDSECGLAHHKPIDCVSNPTKVWNPPFGGNPNMVGHHPREVKVRLQSGEPNRIGYQPSLIWNPSLKGKPDMTGHLLTTGSPKPSLDKGPHKGLKNQKGDKVTTSKGKSYSNSLGFVQFNLNKQRQATSDLGSYIKNIDKPIILAQEPHVNGKGVISKGSYCLRAITCKNPKKPIRASIFFHKSMERQVWWKTPYQPRTVLLCRPRWME